MIQFKFSSLKQAKYFLLFFFFLLKYSRQNTEKDWEGLHRDMSFLGDSNNFMFIRFICNVFGPIFHLHGFIFFFFYS